ncbi:hypothetical protein CC79DRAFT_1352809 [Sarocladium strictum]
MASRASLLRHQRTLAVVALGAIALTPSQVYAESEVANSKRKPIYDDDVVEVPSEKPSATTALKQLIPSNPFTESSSETEEIKARGPTPTDRLAAQIGKARLFLYHQATHAEDALNRTVDSAFNLEESFTRTITSLAPPRESHEKLMPGAIYVLVASMAGSIISRNRNILLRAATPLALGIGAGWVVLPITMRNISELTWKYEKRVPAIAETHLKIREGLQKSASFAKVHGELGARMVDEKVTDAREAVEGWVKQGK